MQRRPITKNSCVMSATYTYMVCTSSPSAGMFALLEMYTHNVLHWIFRIFSAAGQLVLLFHWSMLNYTALIKILKKHGTTLLSVHVRCRQGTWCWDSGTPGEACCGPSHFTTPNARPVADKVSGVELKEPILSNALKQPFSTTGMLSSLMAKCEHKAKELETTTGGLDTLLHTFPQYECLFLIKCVPLATCSFPILAHCCTVATLANWRLQTL